MDVIEAVKLFSRSVRALRSAGIVRSRQFTGDLGEWYVELLYQAPRAANKTQKGWDVQLPSGERAQVKAQSFDPQNGWNYLDTPLELFDCLIVIILAEDFAVRDLYQIPAAELKGVLRVGKEKKPYYYWKDLEPWRVDPFTLPGHRALLELIQRAE